MSEVAQESLFIPFGFTPNGKLSTITFYSKYVQHMEN